MSFVRLRPPLASAIPNRPRSSPPSDDLLFAEGRRRGYVLDEVGQFPVGVVGAVRRIDVGDVRERSQFRSRGELFLFYHIDRFLLFLFRRVNSMAVPTLLSD